MTRLTTLMWLDGLLSVLTLASFMIAVHPESAIGASSTSYCWGGIDNLACPEELCTPDASLAASCDAQYASVPCYARIDFDEIPGTLDCQASPISPIALFVHRLAFTLPGGGLQTPILTVRAKAAPSGESSTDYIAFYQGQTFITGANLRLLNGAFGTWNNSQVGTFSFNLAQLPSAFGISSIVQYMTDGNLDVVIGNETGVDWICLQTAPARDRAPFVKWQYDLKRMNRNLMASISTCDCPCTCDPNCDGVYSDLLDIVATVNAAFGHNDPVAQNKSCPALPQDVDASGIVDVIDIVKTINVVFGGQTLTENYWDPCP